MLVNVVKCLLASFTVVQSLSLGHKDEVGYKTSSSGEDGISTPELGELELWYIAGINDSPVDLLCRGYAYVIKITCPEIDVEEDNNIKSGKIINQTTTYVKEQPKEDNNRYKNVNRTISWKTLGDKQMFFCICKGWNKSVLVAKSDIMIIVKVPKIPKKKMIFRKRVSPKKHIWLKCRISGGRKLHVHWYKNGRQLKLKPRIITSINGVKYKKWKHLLKINTAVVGGSGNYRCVGWNEAGKKFGTTYKVSIYARNDFHNSTERHHDNATSEVKADSSKNVCQNGFAGNDTICPGQTKSKSKTTPLKGFLMPVIVVIGLILVIVLLFLAKKLCGKKNVMTNIAGNSHADDNDDVLALQNIATPSQVSLAVSNPAMMNSECTYKHPKSNTQITELGPNPPSSLMRTCQSLPLLRQNDALVQETNERYPLLFDERSHSTFSFPSCSTEIPIRYSNQPKNADVRYFASRRIGYDGGQITLNNTGIKLIIPEGALPQGRTESIYITLVQNDRDLPHLQEKLSLISHVIKCGPPGLKFEKPVMLIFPHYACVKNGISGFQILSSETKEDEETEWESIFDPDKDPSDDCFCSIDENVCFLSISRFTKYAAVCDCKGKMINIQAYSAKIIFQKEYCIIRVYSSPNSAICRQRIQEDEKEMNGKRCDAVRPLLFKEDGGGLCCTVKDINDEWINLYEDSQDISFQEIWNWLSIPVSHTFTFKRKNPETEMFSCRIDVAQKEIENPTTCTLNIALPTGGTEQARGRQSSESSSGYTSSVEVSDEIRIPLELKIKLLHALDGEDRMDGKDWRMLAEKLNVGVSHIKWLERNKRIDRPTLYILEYYECHCSKDSSIQILCHLAEVLGDMGRHDAAELIREYLSK